MINYNKLKDEIHRRQNAPWNNGRINDYETFPQIEDFFNHPDIKLERMVGFKGDLYRIHTPHSTHSDWIDPKKEYAIDDICEDGSCSVLPITEYDGKVVAFSKSFDFTKKEYYKIYQDMPANFIHIHTGDEYGIDVAKISDNKRFAYEQEVLFPLSKEYLVEEYGNITPQQFKELMETKSREQ